MTHTVDYVEIARRVIQERTAGNERSCPGAGLERAGEPLEVALKGQSVELWSTRAGRLFLVADEEDARVAIEQLQARPGEIYTAAEVRRIVAVTDPAAVAEIHDYKRRFNGKIRQSSD